MLPAFTLARPTSIGDALAALSEDAVPYCGGTELLLAMRAGLLRPQTLVDLKRVAELRAIAVEGDVLRVGAAVPHVDVAASPLVARHAPLLAIVERGVGNARVRAQGTIGGNLCFAEPKSDVATALIALHARVTLASPDGRRSQPVAEFLQGPYWTTRGEDELLTAVEIPTTSRTGVYRKYQTMERPTVGVALTSDASGRCRLVVGAVAETPVAFDFSGLGEVVPRDVADAVEPLPDLTGSERYKRHVTAVYVGRAVAALQRELDATN